MRLLSLALFAGLVACGQTPSTSVVKNETSPVVEAPTPENPLVAKVVGHYAVRVRFAAVQDVPLVGKSSTVGALYSIAQISQVGTGFVLTENACSFVYEGGSAPVKLTVADKVVRATPAQVNPLKVWDDAGTVRFEKDFSTSILGANLVDKDLDALPKSASDSRLVDVEGDGHPGATASASGEIKVLFFTKKIQAQVYFVQRSRNNYIGKVGEGRLSGLVEDHTEQSILGSDNVLLKAVGAIPTQQDPDKSKSSVEFMRITDGAACEQVQFAKLFARI